MSRNIALCALALLCSAALAAAAPITDGLITNTEYANNVADNYVLTAPDESVLPYYDTGLDIDYLGFEIQSGLVNIGVATKQPYLPGGSSGSLFGQTAVAIAFYTAPPTPTSEPLWYLNLATDDDGDFTQAMLGLNPTVGDEVTMHLLDGFVNDNGVKSVDPSITAKFFGMVGPDQPGKGLEVQLNTSLFTQYTSVDPNTALYVVMQLDDLGDWPDDQLVGFIPEPTTLGLLVFGAAALIRRRRS